MDPLVRARLRRLALVALAAVVLVLVSAPAALAGHIGGTFACPLLPDPNPDWTTPYGPVIGGNRVTYLVADVNGGDWMYQWTIGQAAAVEIPWMHDYDADGSLVTYSAGTKIYVWDGAASHLVSAGGGWVRMHPSIAGDTVVWQDHRNHHNYDIWAATLDPITHDVVVEYPVCQAPGNQTEPDIGGDWVVWQDKRDGESDIWARNVVTHHTYVICADPRPQDSPHTDGTRVVWVDWCDNAAGADIYGRLLPTGLTRRICHAPKNQKQPDVDDGFVVWTDYRNAAKGAELPNTSVRGYEWASRATFVIRDTAGMDCVPDIDGDTVVYLSFPDTHMGSPWWASLSGAYLTH